VRCTCLRRKCDRQAQTGKNGFGVSSAFGELSRTVERSAERQKNLVSVHGSKVHGWPPFPHSTFDVGRSMFDVHLGSGLSGLGDSDMKDNLLLQLNNISVVYSDVIQVLKGVSLKVEKNNIVSLLGSNGAGKTTTLKAISGLLKPENGRVTDGDLIYDGKFIQNSAPEDITRLGIIQVLEGRQPFKYLTIEENLRVGTATRWGKPFKNDMEMIYDYFPPLVTRKKTLAGYCSGGELQMLVMGRALMAHPKLLLLDEPSLGLAPLVVKEIFQIIKRVNEEQGVTIVLVEQNASMALQIAHYGYVMENGKIVMEGKAAELRENPDVKEFYLGMGASGAAKSYKDVKSYKRRKRWL